jgi:uncharacterized coiled-coil DUF342 family protein
VEIASLVSLIIGVLGLAGLIFTAMRYNRDDTTAIVNQQNVILGDMKILNDELRTTAKQLREERDALSVQVEELRAQVAEHGRY